MTTPRIEENEVEVRDSMCEFWYQKGKDEAVEIVKSLKVDEKHDEFCDGYCETWSCPWPDLIERNRTLDVTIKALQDNK